jgi:vitamin B12 transporter
VAPVFITPVTETKLKASYGTGFRAPVLSELFINSPGFVANPFLKPETSVGYDVGFEQPLSNWARVGATYFHNNLTNLIQFVVTDPLTFTGTLQNVEKAKTQGWETFAETTVSRQLKLRADYTFTRAFDEITGLELIRRPHQKESVTAIWTPLDRLSVSGTVLHVGEWIDDDRQTLARVLQRGYTVVNLATNYTVNPNVTVFGRVDNLFDRHYEDPTGFLRPGLGAYAGVRVTN